MRTVEVTIPNRPRQYACHVHTVDVTQMLLKGKQTNYGGVDGWQPKSLPTASGRGNQPAGRLPEFNRVCPGLKNHVR